jgi:hypothetical protein
LILFGSVFVSKEHRIDLAQVPPTACEETHSLSSCLELVKLDITRRIRL